jgi:SAM-dependent methyltransferase
VLAGDEHGAARTVGFNALPRADNRRTPPWHRLAYIALRLPRELERLSRELRVSPGDRVLDYGCADAPYRHFFPSRIDYIAADLPGNPAASVHLDDEGRVPIADASVDAVVSTQVLEHTLEPDIYLEECVRVLRPRGRMLLSTHGFMVYHPDPVDLWRWTCAGLERVVRDSGFDVVHFEGIMGLGATGIQLLQDSLFYRIPVRTRPILALAAQSLIAVADRIERPDSKSQNALVFALIAERR